MMSQNDKIRVLFLGEMISSHAQSWMALLDYKPDEFDIMGFSVPGSPYPTNSKFKFFMGNRDLLTSSRLPNRIRQKLLAYIIKIYRPHIIHTFGAFPTAALYRDTIKKYKGSAKWVMQVRGGPDVYMNRLDAEKRAILKILFKNCDVLIADNEKNFEIAEELGIGKNKCWKYGIAPGTGGIDLAEFSTAKKPSQSVKRVIWPKAYEGYESKGMPVLEAIKLAWPKIAGTKFVFLAGNPELNDYLPLLPPQIRAHIELRTRIPRAEILELMKESRVVMAPSLLEGIPNSLYESMAAQCVPIYSPLETYREKFADEKNVIYARNLYPQEIADALVKALTDDTLADNIAENNLSLVNRIANRQTIAENLTQLYKNLSQAQ